MDSFGNHILCCNKAEVYTRHQIIVKCLTVFEAAAGMRVSNEVQVAERERPAAMLVVRLNGSRFGDSRRHCNTAIGASLGLNLRMAKDALAVKEKQNVAKYARMKTERQLHFIPAAISTFGAL